MRCLRRPAALGVAHLSFLIALAACEAPARRASPPPDVRDAGAEVGDAGVAVRVDAAPAAAPCGRAELVPTDDERALLDAVDAARAAGAVCGARGRFEPAPALAWSGALGCASRRYAAAMAAGGFFAHRDPAGHDAADRAAAVGERGPIGEVLARGQRTAADVVTEWLASPEHCAAILASDRRVAGVGRDPSGPLWVMMTGR